MNFYCEECKIDTFIESKEDINAKIEETTTSFKLYFRCSNCGRWFLIIERDLIEEDEKLPV